MGTLSGLDVAKYQVIRLSGYYEETKTSDGWILFCGGNDDVTSIPRILGSRRMHCKAVSKVWGLRLFLPHLHVEDIEGSESSSAQSHLGKKMAAAHFTTMPC